jgi:hypothetical protein
MKCQKSEKWISDGMDRTLAVRKRRKLDSHLESCAPCRAYQLRLKKIQVEARDLSGPALSPDYWQNSIARLRANLERSRPAVQMEIPVRPRQAPAFFPALRWAWAGAASMLAVGVGLYFILFQGRGFMETSPLAFRDQVNSVYEKIGDNMDLETEFNSLVHTSIVEESGESGGEVKHLLYGNSLFLDSLSDEEIQILDAEISKVLKI